MDYLNNILEKANIQVLTEYLLYGSKEKTFSTSTYDERLKDVHKEFVNIIQKQDTAGEKSKLYFELNNLLLEYEHIFMEVGLQAGFLLTKDTQKEIKNNSVQENTDKKEMSMRINLQSIGYFIKEGSRLLQVDKTSFSEREHTVETELERTLQNQLEEEMVNKILPTILSYTSKKEEIQFSLGMKAGAKLALLLTTDFEHDF